MDEDRFGVVECDEDRWKVSFVRRIDRPVEKVWAALTVSERVADWLGQLTLEPRIGGRYDVLFVVPPETMTAIITAFEPPRLLEYRFNGVEDPRGAMVRWELEPDGAGACRLTLVQFGLPRHKVADAASSWHDFIEMISAAADGVATPYDVPRWQALLALYETRLAGQLGD